MEQFLSQNYWLLLAMLAWTIPWKGVALWKAARNQHKYWFIALLVVNTVGILEILYIFIFSKHGTQNEQNIL
jgi:methionyl-tRNA synthetase